MAAIPEHLVEVCKDRAERSAWLVRLPETIALLARRWSLTCAPAFEGDEVSCSWVAPVHQADGTAAILKLGMPHFEAADEAEGLRFWDGDPTVRLLAFDEESGGMLLEQCRPGSHLRALPEPEQDVVLAQLLRRMWRTPRQPDRFRSLASMTAEWSREALERTARFPDAGLLQAGLALFEELPRSAAGHVLLATDLHAGNVLRSEREPWLVIDPKPFVGDPAYDATQHLINCDARMKTEPMAAIRRFAGLLDLDAERVRWWMFARAAVESDTPWMADLARRIR